MITLKTLQELFEKVQNEESVENLQEHKFNLSMEISKLHLELHNGNSAQSKSDILAVINSGNALKDILDDKIDKLKQEVYQKRRTENIERDRLRQQQDR